MGLVKYVSKNKISSVVISILITLLIIMSWKYNDLRSYVNDTIYIESWNFAMHNFAIIELLEKYDMQQVDDKEIYKKQIHKFYYEMYEEYNEICRAYVISDVSGKRGTFDNRLAEMHDDFKRSEILKTHKMIEEVLRKHKVTYKDLEKYMDLRDFDYNQLLVKEWKEIIIELNSLSF